MDDLLNVRMSGPLRPYAAGFASELARQGYTPGSVGTQVRLMAHLSRWLTREGLDVAGLSVPVLGRFLLARRAAGYRLLRSPQALAPMLGYLRGLGVVPAHVAVEASGPGDVALNGFRDYLLAERGLTAAAARGYVDLVAPFVAGRVRDGVLALEGLGAGDVSEFMLAWAGRFSPKTMQRLATALRSLLGFWHLRGDLEVSLTATVPKVAYRSPGLARGLSAAQVSAMLASCTPERTAGLRDRAMLLLLSRLGLRCGEVAGLQLDDVNWRSGQITVRGKGNRTDVLPMPVDVGAAMATYLHSGRPATASGRSVFVRVRAPHRELTAGGVTQAVAAAAQRAGLGIIYGHRLRHTAATSMLAAGGSLTEIGQVLRHRHPLTTATYARVDVEALRPLARPWPGARS
jgi:integrase/recombinase XerD